MSENDVGKDLDAPHPWMVYLPAMTVAEARDLGRAIAEKGFHGRFIDGDEAKLIPELRNQVSELAREVERLRRSGRG